MEVIADTNDLCGECPVWDYEAFVLYWTDCLGRRFYQYRAHADHKLVCDQLEICSFRLNKLAGFVIANTAGVWLWDGGRGSQTACVKNW